MALKLVIWICFNVDKSAVFDIIIRMQKSNTEYQKIIEQYYDISQ